VKLFKESEARLLGPFYAYMFVAVTAMAVFPFMVIYFLDLGFAFSQYFVLMGVWTSGTVFFEVPTGAIADSYSRKWSVIAGLVVAGVTAVGIGLTESYPVLLVLFAVNGIGFTFFSGAEDAWAIDNLYYHNRADLIDQFYAKNQAIMYLGMVAGPLAAGALVGSWGIRPLWFVWGGGYLLAAAGLIFIAEHFTPEPRSTIGPLRRTLQQTGETLRLLRSNRNLGLAFLVSAFIALLFMDSGFWQPLLIDLELPVAGIGYVTAVAAVVGAVLSLLIPKLNRYDFRLLLASGIVVKMVVLFALPLLYGPRFFLASAMFVVVEAAGTFEGPLLNPYIQDRLPSRLRATAVSIKSMIFKLIMGVGGIMLGFLVDRTTLRTVFPVVSLFGIGAVWALLRMKRPRPTSHLDQVSAPDGEGQSS
jgi:MFS family permease